MKGTFLYDTLLIPEGELLSMILFRVRGQTPLHNSILWAGSNSSCSTHLKGGYNTCHFHHPVALIMNIHDVLSSYLSLLFISRTCRALCSNRGQTWTQLEMPWVPCAGLIPLRSCHASPLTSPPLPSEQRLLPSAVPRPGAACRMGYSSTLTVRDMNVYLKFVFCGIRFSLDSLCLMVLS